MKSIHTCIALSLAVAIAAPAWAQRPQPPASEQARAKSPEPVTGEILSVDTNAKMIAVKTTADSEMKFTYSDKTEIVGGEKGAEGLAASAGAIVTVTYDVHGTANVALKIEVKPKQDR